MINRLMSRFPAILIGGPPHTGKSVLAYSLKEALRAAGIQCYLLRAAPDGEGDWSYLAEPQLVQALRRKGKFTPAWVERICQDIAYRPLPFLVDVGGKPQPWQEGIFDQCTHAILLSRDAAVEATWQAWMAKYHLPVLASLTSQLDGESSLQAEEPVLHGIISGLERGQQASGPVFAALLERVKALCRYDYDELLTIHQEQAPVDLVVDLRRLWQRFHPDQPNPVWQPQDLPDVLDYLPPHTSLALYGSGPVWLYAAVAGYVDPAQFYQFDARRGWVKPVSLTAGATPNLPLTLTATETESYLQLELHLPEAYLDYRPEITAPLPPLQPGQGVLLSGKLPMWLYTGLTLFYRQAARVAVYYPPLRQAIVVKATDPAGPFTVGQVLALSG